MAKPLLSSARGWVIKMTYILGINHTYHESSACLIKDGSIVAVAEEERFNRKKHAKPARIDNPDELPVNAINFCLEKAGITLGEVDYIGSSFSPAKRLRNKYFDEKVTAGSWGSKKGEDLLYEISKLYIPHAGLSFLLISAISFKSSTSAFFR